MRWKLSGLGGAIDWKFAKSPTGAAASGILDLEAGAAQGTMPRRVRAAPH